MTLADRWGNRLCEAQEVAQVTVLWAVELELLCGGSGGGWWSLPRVPAWGNCCTRQGFRMPLRASWAACLVLLFLQIFLLQIEKPQVPMPHLCLTTCVSWPTPAFVSSSMERRYPGFGEGLLETGLRSHLPAPPHLLQGQKQALARGPRVFRQVRLSAEGSMTSGGCGGAWGIQWAGSLPLGSAGPAQGE